jgi:hypothetical protein
MPILFDDETRLWALRSGGATYGLTIDEEGCLQHLYFVQLLPHLEDLFLELTTEIEMAA